MSYKVELPFVTSKTNVFAIAKVDSDFTDSLDAIVIDGLVDTLGREVSISNWSWRVEPQSTSFILGFEVAIQLHNREIVATITANKQTGDIQVITTENLPEWKVKLLVRTTNLNYIQK